MEVIMCKALMIATLTAFTAVGAFAAPRQVDNPTTTEEVAGGDTKGSITKPVDEKPQGCGCANKDKPKRNR